MSEPTPTVADPTLKASYPYLAEDAIRYGDTDRQGHVNNAVYATFFEFSRTQMFIECDPPVIAREAEPVLVRLVIDYRGELRWPGKVEIGTAVLSIGTTSVRFAQAVFSDGECAAVGEAVVVQLDTASRRPKPWTPAQRAQLEGLRLR